MVRVDEDLISRLQAELRLERAIETGTYLGETTRALAAIFPAVVTIERSEQLYRDAAEAMRSLANVKVLHGHSAERLPAVVDPSAPSLYFLDGHWSAGITVGADDECPLLQELEVIGQGAAADCIIIDDARLFAAPPPPPHDPDAWPTLLEVLDALRALHPAHHLTVLGDQVIAVPAEAKQAVDRYGQSLLEEPAQSPRQRIAQAAGALVGRFRRPARTA